MNLKKIFHILLTKIFKLPTKYIKLVIFYLKIPDTEKNILKYNLSWDLCSSKCHSNKIEKTITNAIVFSILELDIRPKTRNH